MDCNDPMSYLPECGPKSFTTFGALPDSLLKLCWTKLRILWSMALTKCGYCKDSFEKAALFQGGLCRFCFALKPCLSCNTRVESLTDGQHCQPCSKVFVFEENPRPQLPCRRCSGITLWHRKVVLQSGEKMEQFICERCGFTEHYACNLSSLEESPTCQRVTVNKHGVYR